MNHELQNMKWIEADCDRLQYMGRIDDADVKNPIWIYPCTYVRMRFTGNVVKAVVTNVRNCWTNYIGIIIDGVEQKIKLANEGKQELLLGESLGEGEHEVMLFKRMDACHHIIFHGFIVEEAAQILEVSPLPERRIEVYGDSVSAGEVSEAVDYCGLADPQHDGEYSNSYYSYSWYTARKLNAQLHDIAQGGAALLDGTGWFHGPDFLGMEYIYDKMEYVPEISEVKQWDFSRYTPHVVVIAIGQNDANPENYMDTDYDGEKACAWRMHYKKWVQDIRTKYPNAVIILATTILNHSDKWDMAIDDVCKDLSDPKIYHFLYSNNGCGTHGHIRIPEAEKMADELSAFINSLGDDVWKE